MTGIGRRWRQVIVVILGILSCVALLASTVGVWTHRTLLNTNSWVNAVGPLAKDPRIIDAVAVTLTNEVMQALNVEQAAENALPPKASFLAEPLSTAAHQFVQQTVTKLLSTTQFQQFWVQANRLAHAQAVKILKGESTKGVSTANGEVTLNLFPMIATALTAVGQAAPGILGGDRIPKLTASINPDQAREKLSHALNRPLPPDFGVITVFKSDQLKAAQEGLKLFNAVLIVLLIVTVLLFAGTIALARRRRRAVISLALGSVATLVAATAIVRAVRNQIIGLVGNAQARDAAKATVTQLVSRLDLITRGLLALGLAVALIAFVTGDGKTARRLRRRTAHLARWLVGSSDADVPKVVVWARQHVALLRWGGGALGVVVLLFVVSGWVGLFLTVLVFGLFEVAVTYVASRPMPSIPASDASSAKVGAG
jgi:hypothetical protein